MASKYILTDEGREYLKHGLPEKNLVLLLAKGGMSMGEARKRMKNFSIALQWVLKNKWAAVKGNEIFLTKKPEKFELQDALEKVGSGEEVDENAVSILLSRRLIEREREHIVKRAEGQLGSGVASLTPELIKTGLLRKAKFREYNVEAVGRKLYPGKMHMLSFYIKKIRDILLYGFI